MKKRVAGPVAAICNGAMSSGRVKKDNDGMSGQWDEWAALLRRVYELNILIFFFRCKGIALKIQLYEDLGMEKKD